MTLLIHRLKVLKPQSTVVNKAITLIASCRSAVGTVASKGVDRLSTFLSNPVVKKK
jgi:hypothetical protein